jgi:hypothetical protein
VVDLEPAPTFSVALASPSRRRLKAAAQAFVDLLTTMLPAPAFDELESPTAALTQG